MPGHRKKNNTNGTGSNTTRCKDLTSYLKQNVAQIFAVGTSASTEAEPSTPPFLNLPVEIRTKIYEHVLLSGFKKPYTVKPSNGAGCHFQCVIDGPKCKGTALFRVSRQISFEATTYFYNQLKLEVEDRPYCKNQSTYRLNSDNNAYHPSSLLDFRPFLLAIGETNCASVRHLKINLTRMRTIERTYRWFSTPTTRYLTDALDLLARSNSLRSLEINIDLQGGLDSFTANDTIMKQLRKFSGIQTVKITGQDHTRFITGPKKRATELEKDLKSSPGKIPKEALELFGKRKSDTSQAVLNGKRLALGITRKIEAIKALEAQKKSLEDRLAVYETKCKNVRVAMDQTDKDIAQQETYLMQTAPEDLARAEDMIADAEADEEVED